MQTDGVEKLDHALVQSRPQIVRHARAAIALAVLLAAALGRVQRFIDRGDDAGDGDVFGLATQGVAAAWATGGFHQTVAAQLAKQLFKIRQRDALALADRRERDRASVLAQGQIEHGRYGKSAFGSQTHDFLLLKLIVRYLTWIKTLTRLSDSSITESYKSCTIFTSH